MYSDDKLEENWSKFVKKLDEGENEDGSKILSRLPEESPAETKEVYVLLKMVG